MSFRQSSRWRRRSPRVILACILGAVSAIAITSPQAAAQSDLVIEECNQFADGVNRNQEIMNVFEVEIATFAENAAAAETLEEISAAASQYVGAVDGVTDNLDSLASDLDSLAFTDMELTGYRDEYVGVLTGFNTALAVVSDAMTAVAAAETEEQLSASLEAVADETATAIEQIETLATDESELIDGVNAYCGAE
ncbi:MAG: hypothetical protein AAF892_08855 [Cyanobacteria bacterium P01_D01_bin.71]